jgi:hypothetical protein
MCSLHIPAMKAHRGKGDRAPFTFNLGARWRLVVNVIFLLLCPRYPLNRRLVGPRAALDVLIRAKPLVHAGIRAWVSPVRSLFNILTTLSGLRRFMNEC